MQDKENLLKEISPTLNIGSNFMYEGFTNEEAENDFRLHEAQTFKKGTIAICLLICFLNIYNIFSEALIFKTNKTMIIMTFLTITIIDLILFILIIKFSNNLKTQVKLRVIKFIVNIICSFFLMFVHIIHHSQIKETSLVRAFYVHSLVLCAEYIYLIRNNSKILFYSIFLGFLSLIIFASLTSFTMKLKFKDGSVFYLDKTCNKIINYKKLSEKNNKVVREVIYKGFNSTLTALSNKNSTSLIEFIKALQINMREAKTNSSNLVNVSSNVDMLSQALQTTDMLTVATNFTTLNESVLESVVPSFIDELLNTTNVTYNCFTYYYSDLLVEVNFITSNYLGLIIEEEYMYSNFKLEIIGCLFVPLLFYIISLVSYYRRDIYIKVKQTEALMNYYNHLINNMHCQVISITEDKILFYNKALLNILDSEKLENKNIENPTENQKMNYKKSSLTTITPINFDLFPEINKYFASISLEEKQNFSDEKKTESKNLLQIVESAISSFKNTNIVWPVNLKKSHLSSVSEINLINEKDLFGDDFKYIGTFNKNNDLFFNVYIRKIHTKDNKYILDIMLDEVTETKKAEKINFETKLKQKLFSKMAHEFKTPLMVIKSLISDQQSSSKKTISPDLDMKSKNIIYMSEYITFLINDIIYYSNNKEFKIIKETVDICELVIFCEGVTKSLINVMPGNKQNIKVTSELSQNIQNYYIVSDKTRLKQVLLNFISNAVKFTKFGEIKLSAIINEDQDSYFEKANPSSLKLIISDTGIGMNEKDLDKLRENFGGVLSINTDYEYNQMGTGLGIGIAKSIINKLGYTLEIDSVLGKGTQFTIVIPEPIAKESNNTQSNSSSILDVTLPYNNTLSSNFNFENLYQIKNIKNMFNTKSLKNSVKKNTNSNDNYKKQLNTNVNKVINSTTYNFYNIFSKYQINKSKSSLGIANNNNHSFEYILPPSYNQNLINEPLVVSPFTKKSNMSCNRKNAVTSKILIVDDSNTLRLCLKNLLKSNKFINSKFGIEEARDGIEMLNFIVNDQNAGNTIKLIITDENMEYMSGSTAIEIMRRLEKEKKIKRTFILSLTAFSDEETIKDIKNKGADEILSKPLSGKTFEDFLNNNINKILC